MKKLITIYVEAALIGIVLTSIVSTANAAPYYFNNFESVVGSEWSNTSIDTTPSGRRFLGQFGNGTVSLTLDGLPAHDSVALSFDLFLIHSWDGVNAVWGPDVWTLSVVNGPTLLNTTFSNCEELGYQQSYPDLYPGGVYPAGTGAAEIDTLGYTLYGDSVYALSFAFSHSDSSLVVNFSASGIQGLWDESWGIDNVAVAIPAPGALLLGSIGAGFVSWLRKRRAI